MITRTHRRFTANLALTIITVAVITLTLSTVLGAVAQDATMQTLPTQEPIGPNSFQANPTEAPRFPNEFQANLTPTPTPRLPESIPIDPTETPSGPDSLQANPTVVPTREIDNFQISPTEAPTHVTADVQATVAEAPDDESLALPGTVWVRPGICDNPTFDPYAATQTWPFGIRCYAPAAFNALFFDFALTNGASYTETGSTTWESNGLEFKVPPSTITITQEIPDGFGEPVMYCFVSGVEQIGGTTPSTGNSVALNIAAGQVVSCEFWNIPEVPQSGSMTVNAWQCPQGTAQDLLLTDYLDSCAVEHNGMEFTLIVKGLFESRTTEEGQVHWDSVSLGHISVHVDHMAGFSNPPVVFCGFTESPGGGIQHPAPPPLAGLNPNQIVFLAKFEIPESDMACHWFSIPE